MAEINDNDEVNNSSAKHPHEAQIRECLEHVTASNGFVRSRRLRTLLEYLVQQSLAGQGDKIKATSIAIDVFGRDETFDQQSDPIVRVEAGRLRTRLAEYYTGEGANDSVRIEIPKGTYVPNFLPREDESLTSSAELQKASSARGRGRLTVAMAFATGILFAAAVMAVAFFTSQDNSSERISGSFATTADARPYIVVNPVAATAEDVQSEALASGLAEALITHLSKISGLSVMAHASVLEAHQRGEPIGLADFRSRFGVTHMLRGTIERESDLIVINIQLVDARSAQVLWAERTSRPLSSIIDLEEELALTIAQQLTVQLRPEERSRLSQYHAASWEAWLFYRQGLVTIMPPNDLVRVEAARQLFDRASEISPTFAGGFAGHSFAHSTRVLFMNTTDPAWELANAKAMANRAIELDTEFGAAHAVLAFAQILAGESEQSIESANNAVRITPGDAFARFIIGMSLVISSAPAESIPHLREALRLDPLEPRMPYMNVLAIAYYTSRDYTNAISTFRKNYDRGGPRGPHIDIFVAATHAILGEDEKAREQIINIREKFPHFPARRWLTRWITEEQLLQETLTGLEELGWNG